MALSNSASLLAVPREIRDLIYKELLRIPDTTPPSPSGRGFGFNESFDYNYYIDMSSERFLAYSHLNLLLCNHQLWVELLDFVNTAHSAWEYAKLDCMMNKDYLWLTWTIFPASRAPKIRSLDIDFRIWDFVNMPLHVCEDERLNVGPNVGLNVGSMAIDCILYRLLAWGPGPTCSGKMIPIDMISVHILLQAPTSEEELREYDEDAQLEKIGTDLERLLGRMASGRSYNLVGRVARLKLICGKMIREFVVGDGKSVIDTQGI